MHVWAMAGPLWHALHSAGVSLPARHMQLQQETASLLVGVPVMHTCKQLVDLAARIVSKAAGFTTYSPHLWQPLFAFWPFSAPGWAELVHHPQQA
jgi:hypothetical protein